MKEKLSSLLKKKYTKMILYGVIGLLVGYAYYYFIGCYNGSCPITSKWYTSSLYGMIVGIIAGFPSTKRNR